MVAVPASEKDDLRRVLDDDGAPLPGARAPSVPDAALARMFEVMTLTRVLDDKMARLWRQRRIGFWAGSLGEEACHVAAAPLRATDWAFPSYREHGAWLWRGYSVQDFVDQVFGNHDDPSKGRQLPAHHSARWLNLVSVSAPVGTQIPQAVGAAYAARMQGKDDVAMAMFGEGATSTGEFHVGMNFAAVWKAPCVMVCRNNGWATSVPSAAQTAARTFAAKALGYGMPGIRVDGGDAIAVWQAASEAIDRARRGDGPTLIEVVIRSAGPASVAAPGGDRDADADAESDVPAPPAASSQAAPVPAPVPGIRAGDRRDPRIRLRNYLRGMGLSNEASELELAERCHRQVDDAIAAAERKPAPAVDSLFDDVYEQPPWHLREQRAGLLAQPRAANPHSTPNPGPGPVQR